MEFLFKYIILLIIVFWICLQVVWFSIIKTIQIFDTQICQLIWQQIKLRQVYFLWNIRVGLEGAT